MLLGEVGSPFLAVILYFYKIQFETAVLIFTDMFKNYLISLSLEKAMAPHSSTLAWKIPWTEEPGGLPSMGSHRVRDD